MNYHEDAIKEEEENVCADGYEPILCRWCGNFTNDPRTPAGPCRLCVEDLKLSDQLELKRRIPDHD